MPQPKPYRIWFATTPFRRNGTPVVGSSGSSIERVVIMTGETFRQLMSDNADAMRDVQFEALDMDAAVGG